MPGSVGGFCPLCEGTGRQRLQILRDLVVVMEEPRDKERPSGLYVPAIEEPPDIVIGKVLARGPRCREVILGDRVLYHRFMGMEDLVNGRYPVLILREHKIYAYDRAHRERTLQNEVARLEALSTGTPVALEGGDEGGPPREEGRHLAALRDEAEAEDDPLG